MESPHRGRHSISPQRELWYAYATRPSPRMRVAGLDQHVAPLGLGFDFDSLSHSWRCGLQIYRRLRRLVDLFSSMENAASTVIVGRAVL